MKQKYLLVLVLTAALLIVLFYAGHMLSGMRSSVPTAHTASTHVDQKQILRLRHYRKEVQSFCSKHSYNTSLAFMVDMSLPSGKNRFFMYDLQADSILSAGLVAHGSCNNGFIMDARFSNEPGCGCTSLGKYIVCNRYRGRFGDAYKLKGLDATNSNAYKRVVVLHAYSCVPDAEVYPAPVCNSLGCPMVSYKFLGRISEAIDASEKPMLLYIFR
jgi:hypothetical protein